MKVYNKVEYIKYTDNLTGEYRDCYEKIEGYIKTCFRGSSEAEEKCVYQILGELISAQKNCEPLSMVIGDNLKQYCDKYISLNQAPNAGLVNSLQTSAIYATIILLLIFIRGIKLYSTNFTSNLSFGVIELIALAYVIYWSVLRIYIVKFLIKNNKRTKNLDVFLNILFILFIFPIINIIGKELSFEIKIPFILFILFIAIVIITFVYVNKLRNNISSND